MIRFDSITKKYPGTTRPALDDINVEVLRGEFVFLVGASGSGKSTCLRLILKEDKPTSGRIHVLGQDLRSISNRKVPYFRRNLGVVFQDFRLLPNKSVFENVAFSLQVIGKSRGFIQEAVPDTLKMVGLAEKALRLPHELSGGEQQRVAIARAIVNKPQVLLADEPTGNLDPTTSAGIMALLERINAGGTTVVMATHEAGIVDQMQRRVIELSGGKIVRDERQGGYATAGIPIIPLGAGLHRKPAIDPQRTVSALAPSALPSVFAPASPANPTNPTNPMAPATPALTHPSAPVPAPLAPAAVHVPAAPITPVVIVPDAPARAVSLAETGAEPAAPIAPPASIPRPFGEQAMAIAADSGMPLPLTSAVFVPGREPQADAATATPDTVTDDSPDAGASEQPTYMARPMAPTQDDVLDQLTLAERLGLRAPGEKPDQTGEQNVGPTR
ncbi:cell division ATP-binding protein FtsE [Cryobacterium sp. 5B3]|uniref:cell division ATP-binding protein FtsE n=1 Tax=Cryobacterium sp. 5B3 TaxID=3048586 RepID=UPI002AB5D9A4|nr:cell division ATP-binding protein FtsE [Cryobacterium sp. 5B3]MDY7540878.1 cell division ATP-binding protein FtsE [Cryobacterium sp. 5B3]MEB0275373.1 cell division ATP-binding protein FtsE [Cryobacterium sp. 5B3]